MGGKITIDSATLMNKGLEVIEAHWLFGTPYDRIDVVVHPQSIVHALVALCDGATLAHLGPPGHARADRLRAAPSRPRRRARAARSTSPRSARSTFEPPDLDAFPCLRLAREAAQAGGTATCVLNAANEVAVHAFLSDRLAFMGIPAVIEATLEQLPAAPRALLRHALRRRRRGAAGRGGDASRCALELAARLPRLRRADHPARGRALRRGQGGRDARRALLAVLPAAARPRAPRRDRVRDRRRSRSAAT